MVIPRGLAVRQGWVQLINSSKFHYFRAGKSLCGKWMYQGDGLISDGGSPESEKGSDDCAACFHKRQIEKVQVMIPADIAIHPKALDAKTEEQK